MKRTACALLFVVILSGLAAAEEAIVTKAFTIKFRKIDDLTSLINSTLSEKGALTVQPHLNTVIVQDYSSRVRSIEQAIADFDVPPPSVEISVKLVRATKNQTVQPVSEEIKKMAKMSEVLKFNQYSLLDSGLIQSEEGQPAVLSLANDYQLAFLPDIQRGNNVIRLKNFQLRRKKKDADGKENYTPLISVTLNLKDSETLVLGASRFEESDQALLVILLGKVKH